MGNVQRHCQQRIDLSLEWESTARRMQKQEFRARRANPSGSGDNPAKLHYIELCELLEQHLRSCKRCKADLSGLAA